MTDAQSSHPSLDQLAAFDLGRLRPEEWSELERHVAQCEVCCRKLEALPDDPLVALLRASAGTVGLTPPARLLGTDWKSILPKPADTIDLDIARRDTPSSPVAPAGPEVPAELTDHPRYRILGLLGAGGMGAVFKAEHRLMERVIVLKVIHKHLTDKPAAGERFRLEVKAAARLSHPNIVTAHDADQAGDLHFLVMEFVEGTSLDRLVAEQGPLPVAQACAYARQAALGLQHAFERGMVHRDIKPANLIRTPEGTIKILDFGLARFVSESTSGGVLTEPGAVVGTPDYMAPEQALDPRQADIRADIYGLGCTLYHLLAGRPPFPEGTLLQKLLAHQERTPRPLAELRGDVPVRLVAVLERMLAKDAAQRYQTPAEVATALAPFAQTTEVPGAEPTRDVPSRSTGQAHARPERQVSRLRRFRRRPWQMVTAVALLATVAGLLGLASWRLVRDTGSPGEARREVTALAGPPAQLAAGELRRLGGQTGPFTSVAFSSDGRQALVAGADHTVRLWDLEEGKELGRLPGHTDTVLSLAFSPDRHQALSGGQDRTVSVWDLAGQRRLATLEGHVGPVRGVTFTWDNRHAFSAGDDSKLVLWDTRERRLKDSLSGNGYAVHGLALEKMGQFAALGCSDKLLRVCDVDPKGWRPVRSYAGHGDAVTCVTWSRDMRYLLSGSADGTVRLWRGTTDRQLCRFAGHTGAVRSVALSADQHGALSGGEDGTVRLWDVAAIQERACFRGHEGTVLAVGFLADGRQAVSGSADGTLRFWQLPPPPEPARKPPEHTERVGAVAITPDGKLMAVARGDETVALWDIAVDKEPVVSTERAVLKGHAMTVLAVAITADGKTVASTGWDKTIKLWEVRTGRERATLRGHAAEVRSLAFTADSRTLASGGADGTVRLWDVATGSELRALEGHAGEVRAVALTADGRTLASGGEDHSVRLWDLAEGARGALAPRSILKGHTGPVNAVAFSGDGRTLISGSDDQTAVLWDMATGEQREVLRGHAGAVTAVAITTEGETVATGSADRTIQLRGAVVAGSPDGTATAGHSDAVSSLVFTADGKHLAAASRDGQVRLWPVLPSRRRIAEETGAKAR